METSKKLQLFTKLPEGWHLGEGSPIEQKIIDIAQEILKVGESKGFKSDCFPGRYGEIEVAFYIQNDRLGFTIEKDETINYTRENDIKDIDQKIGGLNLEEAIEIFNLYEYGRK